MEYIRLLHPSKFDHIRRCYSEIAFCNHESDGCASVIDKGCIDAQGKTYCKHIKTFYSKHIRGDPSIFWIFNDSVLPNGATIVNDNNHKDPCHRNVSGASDDDLGDIISNVPLHEIFICENGNSRPLTQVDVPQFVK
jgi:hypothetical protein